MQEIRIVLDPAPPEGMFSDIELDAMTRILAPVVLAEACVGCGICQYRCHMRNVVQERALTQSAIQVRTENLNTTTAASTGSVLTAGAQVFSTLA